MKPRVLMLTSSFPRDARDQEDGGGGFVRRLAEELAVRFEVHVLAPGDPGDSPLEGGVRVHHHRESPVPGIGIAFGSGIVANLRRRPWLLAVVPFFLLFQFLAMARIVRAERIDAVHAHWLVPQGLVAAVYKRLFAPAMPLLITVHGSDWFALRGRIGNAIRVSVARAADRLTVVSSALRTAVTESGCTVEGVMPMGVDVERFVPGARDGGACKGPCLLFVGYCIESKGIRELIQAMPAVSEAHLHVIGDGDLKHGMQELARVSGVQERVRFEGHLDHAALARFYSEADLLVLPSKSEGFGLVLIEAMAAGTIPLVTNLPAFRDILTADTGFVLGDGVPDSLSAAIPEALRRLRADPEMRTRARRSVVERFAWRTVGERYASALSGLVGS